MDILMVISVAMEAVVENKHGVKTMSTDNEEPLDINTRTLVAKLEKFMVSKAGNLLPCVKLKGKKGGYYYSPGDNEFVYLDRNCELYLLPWKKDDKGRLYLYSPYTFKQGIIILAEEDEIILLGFN